MKSFGILGLGPQATVELQRVVHTISNERIEPAGNAGYPTMIAYHHRRPPVEFGPDGPLLPLRADPELLEAAAWLGSRVDFVVIAANAPHQFAPEIAAAAGRPLLSMIEVTLDEVQRRGWNRVGVLGFFDRDVPVYTEPMRSRALQAETIDDSLQEPLNTAILHVMEGRETDEDRAAGLAAVDALRARAVDGVIPGCTEIPMLLGDGAHASDLTHPLELLASAIVDASLEG